MNEDFLQRFSGVGRLYGLSALEKFSQSKVMVVGLGGVGSWVAEGLARSGVGKFSLVDLDDLCITNTNRQVHALTSTVGQSKARALAERITEINPNAEIEIHQEFYSEKNSTELLVTRPDLVVDAIDSVRAKCHLLATAHELQIPVISSGGAGGRIDPSQIQTADLAKTHGCALLLAVRKKLRAEYGFPKSIGRKVRKMGIPAVFSPEMPKFPTCDGEISTARPADLPGTIKCDSGYGAATHLTATFANHISAWVLAKLAGSSNLP